MSDERFDRWLAALEARHFAELTFPEVRRALVALSSLYVERRDRLAGGAALASAGKRAAYALFHGPLHFLLVERIVRALGAERPVPARILDLGCGTGAAGAAWALATGGSPSLLGVDASPWALGEARQSYRELGLRGQVRRAPLAGLRLPPAEAVVSAYTLNELADPERERMLLALLAAAGRGAAVLVVEPLARRAVPWWDRAARRFVEAGGRADEWRFAIERSDLIARLDHAAGLDHRQIGARTLWLRSPAAPPRRRRRIRPRARASRSCRP